MRPASYVALLLGGMLFGFGLAWSGMVKPEIVLSFLRFEDFGLLLVLASATGTTFFTYRFLPKLLKKPVLEPSFGAHHQGPLGNTIKGAALFGIGWGLCGVCPGPAIAGLGTGNWPLIFSVIGLFAGAWAQGWWASRSAH
ncbi:Hypothetical protein HDN1F_25370 [gamma proteobacterium HdN1]|nr:Hypothetical protein HDN1F_25370 [gamma proteobacterium HdN1]